ncbi:helix-turn-helix domain-containing protein [Ralstonia solanacearum]|uniref:helix-turn-helix domain-containing protein n=1 Tax=Ralstonia solanacearum TaxID=305 RepID=UPI001CC2BD2E|nr:helix-turn-helix domain-containing protein [Ralstonia solanacearum]
MRSLSLVLLKERRFGARAADLLILIGVMIGEAEGRPLGAFKLAELVGVPRPTVIRRLARMARAGLVQRDGRGTTKGAGGLPRRDPSIDAPASLAWRVTAGRK